MDQEEGLRCSFKLISNISLSVTQRQMGLWINWKDGQNDNSFAGGVLCHDLQYSIGEALTSRQGYGGLSLRMLPRQWDLAFNSPHHLLLHHIIRLPDGNKFWRIQLKAFRSRSNVLRGLQVGVISFYPMRDENLMLCM